jgi:hypothetical protein
MVEQTVLAPIAEHARLRFHVPSFADRSFWDRIAADPRTASLRTAVAEAAAMAPAVPPRVTAEEYLAVRERNDRSPVDRHLASTRRTLSALVLSRALLGDGPDQRLVDWLWGIATEPSWAHSAHIKGLPRLDQPCLDLGTCCTAVLLAEAAELLQPWLQRSCPALIGTLCERIAHHALSQFASASPLLWWEQPDRALNWLGVCAGSLFAAASSLERLGQPHPEAKARSAAGLARFIHESFTPAGECDEGIGYWTYGMTFAGVGLDRMDEQEFRSVDRERLRLVAEYPRRAHLFGEHFFSGNDSGTRGSAPLSFSRWAAAVTGSSWLAEWSAGKVPTLENHLPLTLRQLHALDLPKPTTEVQSPPQAAVLLCDQQAGILRIPTPRGELIAAVTGGHNDERHNHNDLGHFVVAFGGEFIVPDFGAPSPYAADFFGPRRYAYLAASSRGHCCPIVNGCEQRAGRDAFGIVRSWRPEDPPHFELDLTPAYPPEADLRSWTRRLDATSRGAAIIDRFRTRPGVEIELAVWSTHPPRDEGRSQVIGPLRLSWSRPPSRSGVDSVAADDHALKAFAGTILHRIHGVWRADDEGRLDLTMTIEPSPT